MFLSDIFAAVQYEQPHLFCRAGRYMSGRILPDLPAVNAIRGLFEDDCIDAALAEPVVEQTYLR